MRQITHFDRLPDPWPDPKTLEPNFLGAKGRRWVFESDTDQAGLLAEGADGTQHLERTEGRVDIDFFLTGHPDLGVLLTYGKYRWGSGHKASYCSKGDLGQLDRYYRGRYGSLLPIGLFIPFEDAWMATKEFILTNGDLPGSIEWIASGDLPPDAFPPQSPSVVRQYRSRVVFEYRPGPS
jgi:hypothetical protein